jgi:hypothetical protein
MTDTVTPTTIAQPHRVAFDVMAGVEPITFPAGTTTEQITDRLRRAFLAAEAIDVDDDFAMTIDFEAGAVAASTDGDVFEHGSITAIEPEPDYWLTLAANLREAADRIATLAGTPAHVRYVTVNACAGLLTSEEAAGIETVDALAAAFGETASTGHHKGSSIWEHRADIQLGKVEVSAYATVQKPASVEDELRARVAELEAQIAGGTR